MFSARLFAITIAVATAIAPASPAAASAEPTIRAVATDAADLVTREQALLADLHGAGTDEQLRSVDDDGYAALGRLEALGVRISPAVRSALEPLPRNADGEADIVREGVPPSAVYDAAAADLLRIAATPEAMTVGTADDGVPFGLLAIAAVSLVVLGLVAFGASLRRREDVDEIMDLAWNDGLTGVANRRRLDHDLNRYDGAELPTAAIMVDVDHLDVVIHSYGSRVGDDVLRQVATMLTHHVRFDDVVYRYDEVEFCILLPDASIEDARTVASRIVEAARAIALPDGAHLTVSVGVAQGGARGTTIADVVASADRALDAAKQNGRNCAVTASTEPADA